MCMYYVHEIVMRVSVVSTRRSVVGEGPHWDERSQTLLHVDLFAGDVCRLEPRTQDTRAIHLDHEFVTLAVPYASNPRHLLVTTGTEVRRLQWDTGETEILVEVDKGEKRTRFNDGKCDSTGRLWAGTMGLESSPAKVDLGQGSLFSLDPNSLTVSKQVENLNLSNGMAWSSDNRLMFFIDSVPGKLYVFDCDVETGVLSNQRTLVDFTVSHEYQDCGIPDGMTVDIEGKLWVACYNGSCVVRIDPARGNLLQKIEFPVSNITSCCFGGPNYDELYVTSALLGLTGEQRKHQQLAGAVFKVADLGVKGFAPACFRR
ncbi:regucalcin-like isoform X2 [Tachypleus tridentatus]|uniref:regucalcin-like isoform X2 n=1 Tax=Tachypleus tridentatus TaxID=6853 RepID=UPI003FD149B1